MTKAYYALTVSQRKYATAQQALDQAKQFLDITQALERASQAPHSDVIKAQIQYKFSKRAGVRREALLSMEDTRLDLAVLLFPTLKMKTSAWSMIWIPPQALPTFPEVQTMASRDNPGPESVAIESSREADLDVKSAQTAFLPTLTVETDYGLEANSIGVRTKQTAFPALGSLLPSVGYFLTVRVARECAGMDWERCAASCTRRNTANRMRRECSQSQAQRVMLSELYADYNEAAVARSAVDKLVAHSRPGHREFRRLVNLRYQGGSSTVLDVVDAGRPR